MSATLKATHNLQSLDHRDDVIHGIGAALRVAYSDRHAAKAIATDADTGSRTAEAWVNGRTPPRSPELLELMAANDEFQSRILALVAEIKERRTCRKQS